jgi:hypothetical protein
VSQLPPEIREWLDQALVAGNFSDYELLTEEVKKRGYLISKSSLHRSGQSFEERLGTIKRTSEMAKAIKESVGDDAGAIGEALTAVMQEKLFEIAMKIEDPGDVELPALVRAIADLNRTSVSQKKWAAEVKAKAKAAADQVEKAARKGGATEEQVAFYRQEILGIVG